MLAKSDLFEIHQYIALDSPAAVDRFIQKITDKLQTLADQPGLGAKRDELGTGFRSSLVGTYLIFYRKLPGGIEIMRVVSGYRDIDALFEN